MPLPIIPAWSVRSTLFEYQAPCLLWVFGGLQAHLGTEARAFPPSSSSDFAFPQTPSHFHDCTTRWGPRPDPAALRVLALSQGSRKTQVQVRNQRHCSCCVQKEMRASLGESPVPTSLCLGTGLPKHLILSDCPVSWATRLQPHSCPHRCHQATSHSEPQPNKTSETAGWDSAAMGACC